jgi:hypothetical protein
MFLVPEVAEVSDEIYTPAALPPWKNSRYPLVRLGMPQRLRGPVEKKNITARVGKRTSILLSSIR